MARKTEMRALTWCFASSHPVGGWREEEAQVDPFLSVPSERFPLVQSSIHECMFLRTVHDARSRHTTRILHQRVAPRLLPNVLATARTRQTAMAERGLRARTADTTPLSRHISMCSLCLSHFFSTKHLRPSIVIGSGPRQRSFCLQAGAPAAVEYEVPQLRRLIMAFADMCASEDHHTRHSDTKTWSSRIPSTPGALGPVGTANNLVQLAFETNGRQTINAERERRRRARVGTARQAATRAVYANRTGLP